MEAHGQEGQLTKDWEAVIKIIEQSQALIAAAAAQKAAAPVTVTVTMSAARAIPTILP